MLAIVLARARYCLNLSVSEERKRSGYIVLDPGERPVMLVRYVEANSCYVAYTAVMIDEFALKTFTFISCIELAEFFL